MARVRGRDRSPRQIQSLEDRFRYRVQVNGPIVRPGLAACHQWTGSVDKDGYGQIRLGRRGDPYLRAHRVAFFLQHGRWPTPCCLHRCDNSRCVNPDHLYEGTPRDNMRDRAARGRQPPLSAAFVAQQVHAKFRFAKINGFQADAIRKEIESGTSFDVVASRFGIGVKQISRIWRHEAWKSVEAKR